MDFPENFESLSPEDLTTDKAIQLLLAAIAYEQFALGNIIDAEADKINHAVSLSERGLATPDEVRKINDSAFKVLKTVIKKEMLLEFQLDDLNDFIPKTSTSSTTTTSTSTTTSATYTSFTTTNDSKCKWLTLGNIMFLLTFIVLTSYCIQHCDNNENCEEEECCNNSNRRKEDNCKKDIRYRESNC